MSERGECGNFMAGVFFGAALGSIAAVLLAPRPGRELRRGLSEGGEKIRETTSRTVSELKGSKQDAREAFERAREALVEAADGLKEATKTMAGRGAA